MTKIITLTQLKKLGACKGQCVKFESLFGLQVTVTRELCLEHAGAFDWTWAARHLLPKSALAEYDKARASALAEYDKARASASAEYDKAIASALAEYDKARASASAEYDKAIASAWAEYNKARASAWAEYNKARASAFADLFLNS